MIITDLETGKRLLLTQKFKSFVMQGMTGGGFLDDDRIKYFWHGLEMSNSDYEEIKSPDIIGLKIKDFFDLLGIIKEVPKDKESIKMCFQLVEGSFKMNTFTSIVFPAFIQDEAQNYIDNPTFIDFEPLIIE